MKPTSLLIPALGLFASCAMSAAISKRSDAAVPRAATLPEGVATFPDVSKRGEPQPDELCLDPELCLGLTGL